MKKYFFLLVMAFCLIGPVDAKDRDLPINQDGSISGVPAEFGAVRLDARDIANPASIIGLQIGMNHIVLPPCVRKYIKTNHPSDIRAKGSWYRRESRGFPYYIEIDFFDPGFDPDKDNTRAIIIRFNIHDASIFSAERIVTEEVGNRSWMNNIYLKDECGIVTASSLNSLKQTTEELPQRGQAPTFDRAATTPLVVVGTTAPGGYYETPEKCKPPDAFCMQFPLWFLLRPTMPVYGKHLQTTTEVTTWTHYGQPGPEPPYAPSMRLLLEENGRFEMPSYARVTVWRRSDGEYFYLIDRPEPIYWLPCSISELREPIDETAFPTQARFELDNRLVTDHPELFERHEDYASPRNGISITRLKEFLQRLQPSTKDFSCKSTH